MNNIWRLLDRHCNQKLVSDRRGAVLPIFGVMVIMIVVIAGTAVDVSRSVSAREKLSYALDAAALSLATDLSTSLMSDTEVKDALTNSLKANLGSVEFLDEAVANLTYKIDTDNGLVTVDSWATLDNYFIDIGGYMKEHLGPETFAFRTSSQATYSQFDVELAMVLDVTGSMAPHMETLKDAAKSALNVLIPVGTNEADSKVRISVVPYSQGVNLGEYAQKVAKGAQGTQNCVTERQGTAQFTDDTYDYDRNNQDSYFGGGSWGCAPTPQLEPLTAKRNKIEVAIDKLIANGGTAGQTGIAWGWYTLSPNWANLWPATSEPASYSDRKVLKFALIMTDGDFNTFYWRKRLSRTECENQRYWGNVTENCRGGRADYWYQDFSESGYGGTPSQRAVTLCKAMKDEGITVFSVFFGSYNPDPERVMKECASEDGYYQATSKEELVRSFANIAKKIQAIYLSK